MSDSADELGGEPILPVLLVGRGPLVGRFGAPGPEGLSEAVAGATGGTVTLQITPTDPASDGSLLESLTELDSLARRHPVTVLVLEGDLRGHWPADIDQARAMLSTGIQALKDANTRVIAVGVSTLDPSGRGPVEAAAERSAHELGLLLLEMSVEEGISVLDTDRIVAELGGGGHVEAFLEYDEAVQVRLIETMVEILADYGFFEARPLLPQVGVRNR